MISPRHKFVNGRPKHMHGWRLSMADHRDAVLAEVSKVSSKSDLRITCPQFMPALRDQGSVGSCTSNAGCEAAGYLHRKMTHGAPDPMFSRLDLYATTRELEGTPLTEDSGCQVRDVFKSMKKNGVCLESTWPYDVAKFSAQPSRAAAVEALQHKAESYLSCRTLHAIKTSIDINKYPVIGGFTCYASMFAPSVEKTGLIPIPHVHDKVEGGHCVMWVGFNDDTKTVIFQNSWGPDWGDHGFGELPYHYFETGLASDHWSLRAEKL